MRARREQGYTLTELVVVISVMAIIAAISMPGLSGSDESKLDIAAANVAGAIRFAHGEAVRTGATYGVYASDSEQRLRIYRRPVATPIYDVYDPLSKQLLEFQFESDSDDVALAAVHLAFDGVSGSKSYLGFAGGSGTPGYDDFGTARMLNTGYMILGYREAQRTISVSPMTGRVTIQ